MKNMAVKICILAAVFFVISSLQAAQLPKIASLVPPETALLIEINNFHTLKEQFEKTPYYKLYLDPLMAPFIEKAKASLKEKVSEQDDNNIYKMFYSTGIWPEGKLAVAVVLNEQTKQSKDLPILFITRWGDSIDKIKEAVKKLVVKNTELGGRSKPAEDFRGVSIETMVDEDSVEFSYCFVEDCFIGSVAGVDALKFVVAHIKGADSPSLADQSDYGSSLAATGPDNDIVLYVNIKHMVKTASAEDTSGEAQKFFSSLGLDNVSSFCCSVGIARQPANASCGRGLLKIEGEKKGICRLLDCSSASIQAPRFIPSSTYSLTFINLNVKAAFDELVKIASSFSPQAAAVFYMPLLPAGPEGQPGLELKRDIIEHLGSQIILTKQISKPLTDAIPVPKGLFAVVAANPRALEKSLSEIHSKFLAPNNPQARRELLGHTIYLIDLSSFLPTGLPAGKTPLQDSAGTKTEQADKIAFTITDTHLIAGPESSVEQALRTMDSPSAESLVSAKWFNTAKEALPSVTGLAALQDDATAVEILWRILKKTPHKEDNTASDGLGVSMGVGMGVSSQAGLAPQVLLENSGPFDLSLLPEFESVKKYFGLSALYGVSRPDGFFFELKELPAQNQ